MAFCTKCGAKIPDGTAFCTSCGAPIQAPAQQAQPTPPVQQPAPAPQQQYQQVPPQQYQVPPQQQYQQTPPPQYRPPVPNYFDHTAEFKDDDRKKHKTIAILFYVIIIAAYFITCDGINFGYLFSNFLSSFTRIFTDGLSIGSVTDIIAFGAMGTLIFAGAAAYKDSDYVKFHAKMAARLLVCSLAAYFIRIVPFIGLILSDLTGLFIVVLAVISLIMTMANKSKEPFVISYIIK